MIIKTNDSQHSEPTLLNELLASSSEIPNQSPPTTEQLLNHIDAEISQLRAREAAGGWNAWALLGAGVAVGALLLSSLEAPNIQFTIVAFWFICFSLIADGLISWFIPGSGALIQSDKSVRTRRGIFFRHRIPLFIIALIRNIALIVFALITGNEFDKIEPGLLFLIVAIYYFVKSITIIGLLWSAFSNRRYPDDLGSGEGIRAIQNIQSSKIPDALFFTVVPLLLVYAYAHAAGFISLGQPSPTSLRIGFLIAILVYILLWLIDVIHKPPIIDGLLDIRRNLVFGKMTIQQAMHKVEEVLHGGLTVAELQEIKKKAKEH